MLAKIAQLAAFTAMPAIELRGSIPYGIHVLGLPWLFVSIACIIFNIAVGLAIYPALAAFINLAIRIDFINRAYQKLIKRPRRKISRYTDKWGMLGLALFIAIPLPGSGVFSGAAGAHALGLRYKQFAIATCIGVFISGVIVTVVSAAGFLLA